MFSDSWIHSAVHRNLKGQIRNVGVSKQKVPFSWDLLHLTKKTTIQKVLCTCVSCTAMCLEMFKDIISGSVQLLFSLSKLFKTKIVYTNEP